MQTIGADMNDITNMGINPLSVASYKRYAKPLNFLIEQRLRKQPGLDKYLEYLLLDSLNGVTASVCDLLNWNYSFDINGKDEYGWSALMLASMQGYQHTADVLIRYGADVNASNKEGLTALMLASQCGYIQIVRLLIEHGANLNVSDQNGMTALMWASQEGYLEIVQDLMNNGADLNDTAKNGRTPYTAASSNGYEEIVEFLTSFGKNSCFGYTKPVKSLIKDRLAEQDDLDILAKCIFNFAYNGNTEVLDEWLGKENDFEIDSKDRDGWTALMLASLNGCLESVDCLIGYGADLNASNEEGLTALMLASQCGCIETVKLLRRHGAKVNVRDKSGMTALMWASLGGDSLIVDYLRGDGADLK